MTQVNFGEVRDACFGVNLQQQGRGYYIALELLAVVRGCVEADHPVLASDDQPPTFVRHSHDAARRLAAGESALLGPEALEELGGVEIAELLGRLFRSLTITVPGRRGRQVPWQQLYLTPYNGDLIHWDAVQRNRRGRGAVIEEYSFRGVGAYAHRLLRSDPDRQRLDQTREAFIGLVEGGATPLSVLARATRARDEADVTVAKLDSELTSGSENPGTPWPELLRAGVHSIVCRPLPREARVELLLHWVPYVMARHVLDIARIRLGHEGPAQLVADFSSGPTPVRSLARRQYKDAVTTIVDAMDHTCIRLGMGLGMAESERRRRWGPPRSFFTGTLSMVGALNAPSGSQHLTLGLPLLESVVAATVPAGQQVEFSAFCRDLADRCGIVIDARSAAQRGLLEYANASDFERNADGLGGLLRSIGALHQYSDSTQMVSVAEVKG